MVCKEDVLSWFKDSESHERIDLMHDLLNMCMPFEIRFLGTYMEELGKHSYDELRGLTITANDSEKLAKETEAMSSSGGGGSNSSILLNPTNRHRLCIYLSLLSNRNTQCAQLIYSVFRTEHLDDQHVLQQHCAMDDMLLTELLLMFNLALLHPAFTFRQKLYYNATLLRLNSMRPKAQSHHVFKRSSGNVVGSYPPGFGFPASHMFAQTVPVKMTVSGDASGAPVQHPPPGIRTVIPGTEFISLWPRPSAFIHDAQMIHQPPQPISPFVSQSTSPPHSRASSPHRGRSGGSSDTVKAATVDACQQTGQGAGVVFFTGGGHLSAQQQQKQQSVDSSDNESCHMSVDGKLTPTEWMPLSSHQLHAQMQHCPPPPTQHHHPLPQQHNMHQQHARQQHPPLHQQPPHHNHHHHQNLHQQQHQQLNSQQIPVNLPPNGLIRFTGYAPVMLTSDPPYPYDHIEHFQKLRLDGSMQAHPHTMDGQCMNNGSSSGSAGMGGVFQAGRNSSSQSSSSSSLNDGSPPVTPSTTPVLDRPHGPGRGGDKLLSTTSVPMSSQNQRTAMQNGTAIYTLPFLSVAAPQQQHQSQSNQQQQHGQQRGQLHQHQDNSPPPPICDAQTADPSAAPPCGGAPTIPYTVPFTHSIYISPTGGLPPYSVSGTNTTTTTNMSTPPPKPGQQQHHDSQPIPLFLSTFPALYTYNPMGGYMTTVPPPPAMASVTAAGAMATTPVPAMRNCCNCGSQEHGDADCLAPNIYDITQNAAALDYGVGHLATPAQQPTQNTATSSPVPPVDTDITVLDI